MFTSNVLYVSDEVEVGQGKVYAGADSPICELVRFTYVYDDRAFPVLALENGP